MYEKWKFEYLLLCQFSYWVFSLLFFELSTLVSLHSRYLRPLVADVAVVSKCHLSALYRHEKGKLFAQLVDLLQFYENFEISDHSGRQLTDDEVLQSHYDRFQSFQLLAFKKIPRVCHKSHIFSSYKVCAPWIMDNIMISNCLKGSLIIELTI